MRVKAILALGAVFFMLSVISCTTVNIKPAQTASYFMQVYNAEYDDTMKMATDPNATPAQKEMVAKKKAILMKARPLIRAYDDMIRMGQTPDPAKTQEITDLINQLTAMAIGGGK